MLKVALFDQEVRPYRERLYGLFKEWFAEHGIEFKVYCDCSLREETTDLVVPINYSFDSFRELIRDSRPDVVISFVLLRYTFLIPFLIYLKFYQKIPLIVWSHGVNLKKPNQVLKNQLYYLRHRLADALILYSENERGLVKKSSRHVFVAPNTLNFYDLPIFDKTKERLKAELNYSGKRLLLSVGRFNANDRSIKDLVWLARELGESTEIVIIGPGVSDNELNDTPSNLKYLGPLFDQRIVSMWYAAADIFLMPGRIGLAVNNAFFYSTPVIVKGRSHAPEFSYLSEGVNGEVYSSRNELLSSVMKILQNDESYKRYARETILKEATPEMMFDGFLKAIQHVTA